MEIVEKKFEDHKFLGVIVMRTGNVLDSIRKIILQILEILNSPIIDEKYLKNKISSTGILEMQPSLRSLCWKVLLDYLPRDTLNWESYIDDKRNEYIELKKKYFPNMTKKHSSHPLNNSKDSHWDEFFQNSHLNQVIEKDLKRTRNEEPFFTQAKKSETHIEVIKRILILFARRHPEIEYVQGLNEILATIYFCFAQDQNPYFSYEIEADSFFCFENIICKVPDIYIESKDYTVTGIKPRLEFIKEILCLYDYKLFNSLNEMSVDVSLIDFKWYTLFFAQDFSLQTLMRLWDFLFCQDDIFKAMNILCVAALEIKKKDLLSNDLGTIMTSLQTFQKEDVSRMISKVPDIMMEMNNHSAMLDYENFAKKYIKLNNGK